MKNYLQQCVILAFLSAMFGLTAAWAQVVMDGSMGAGGALKGPEYKIKSEYGRQAGSNLFHSFRQFDINTNENATFSGPDTVQNIISRVTGGDSSWIDGKIGSTISGANLYLLNPAGVMFGANASLDIGGSFHVSTADYLRLGRNERFYTEPVAGEVLSAASPAAFGFLDDDIAGIAFEGAEIRETDWNGSPTGLNVPQGETISVIGGNIEIDGTYYQYSIDESNTEDVSTGSLGAPRGRINIASLLSDGEAIPTESGTDITSEKNGEIRLDHALLSVGGEGAGDVFISGGTFFADTSKIEADTIDTDAGVTDIRANTISISSSDVFSNADGAGKGGGINLVATESVSISDLSRVFADAWDSGDAGDVRIETEKLSVTKGGAISSDTYESGKGGNISLLASESVSISNPESKIFANARGEEADAGDGGTIRIETRNFSLSDKGNISSDTYDGGGEGGHILISGTGGGFAESAEVSDAQILSGTRFGEEPGDGAGGIIEIKAKQIAFTNTGRIRSESDGSGKGGDVILRASESLLFSGSDGEWDSKVYTTAMSKEAYAGDAGNIAVEADRISFKDGGGITASTQGPGNAGVISVKANQLELDTGASISSASEVEGHAGDAGSISVDVQDTVILNHSSSITTETMGGGNAGDITLGGRAIYMDNISSVSSASASLSDPAGDAGRIRIDIADLISFGNDSFITTQAENAGKGQIDIDISGGILQMSKSRVTTSIRSGGNNAGDINIKIPEWNIMNHSRIVANAWEGRGGNIHIVADHFVQSSDSLVDASSALGIDGTVLIESPDVDVSGALTILPSNMLDAAKWMRMPCSARDTSKISRFVLTGKDAIPTPLDDWLPAPSIWFDEKKNLSEN